MPPYYCSSAFSNASLPQTLLVGSGTWQTSGQVLPGKTEAKKALCTSGMFFVSLDISSPTCWATSCCTYWCYCLSDSIHFPSWFQLWLSSVFRSSIPAYSGSVSRFFKESSYVLPPSVYFFFVFHLLLECLAHVCWPSAVPAQIFAC